MSHPLDRIVAENRTGGPALPSVCTAHPDVLTASLMLAERLDREVLIEATSNQVNQFGGYTGMTPADFTALVRGLARDAGCDPDRILFGGDHLGPQAWKRESPEAAMAKARDMITAYARAGITKLHLDCSEGLGDEPEAAGDALSAARAADLCAVAEAAAPGVARYVIGTEVPPPGGARVGHDDTVAPTSPERAAATLAAHRAAFDTAGLSGSFDRVRGLVVQPGLEFGNARIDRFDMDQPDHLSAILPEGIAFEAHSTDYQHAAVFPDLARRHFAILKVGPALTFAWREALYGLSHVHGWLTGAPHVSQVMETEMLADPGHWQGHVTGPEAQMHALRHTSYADRIRYYWPRPAAQAAVTALTEALTDTHVPAPLLAQYIPPATLALAEGIDAPLPRRILLAHVQAALEPYFAC